jgi:hypothetical protein
MVTLIFGLPLITVHSIPLRMSDEFTDVRSFRSCGVKPLIAYAFL